MKKIVNDFIWSKSNKTNGLAALCLVGLFVLGCTCGKGLNSDSESETSSTTPSQTSPNQPSSNRKLPTFRGDDKKTDTKTSDDSGDSDDTPTNSGDREEIPSDSGKDILTNGKLPALIENTVLDFADAVESEDFSSFHSNCSKPFKAQYSAEKLNNSFSIFVKNKVIAVPIFQQVSDKEPILAFSKIHKAAAGQVLSVAGTYPTSPRTTSFDNQYLLESGVWRVIKIELNINP